MLTIKEQTDVSTTESTLILSGSSPDTRGSWPTRKKQSTSKFLVEDNSGIHFVQNEQGDLCSFKSVRKVHEVNGHKGKEQFMAAYRNAGGMSPELASIVERVVNDCKVCQKFQKSVAQPRVTLPKSTSFNEVVTLDLKDFGNKYVLWMIDSFSRFMMGKLLSNKKEDTIIQAIMDCWCMNLGFPASASFGDNGREFANVKMDELTSKFGILVMRPLI